eukprot:TRINITY_DN22447_c0_g1_i1.p1 TRINITY_DN22447_c0_g1~~TRINITY_DN22447_c0_g1_i1.p1  ORF type:complete len:112 (-),score=31.02 TRINITY_DN22447_c0_g1_i1:161-496(-)
MARSRAMLAPVAALALAAAAAYCATCFVAAPQGAAQLRGQQAALVGAASFIPAAAQAMPEMPDVDMGSSVTLASTIELIMLGIVLGTVPISILGLFVAAWLQFKKGPTLGI